MINKHNTSCPNTPFGRFLAAIDARDDFGKLPRHLRNWLHSHKHPPLQVLIDDNTKASLTAEEIRQELQIELDTKKIEFGFHGKEIYLQDYFVAAGIFTSCFHTSADDPDGDNFSIFSASLREKADKINCDEVNNPVYKIVIIMIHNIYTKFSRIDGFSYWLKHCNRGTGNLVLVLMREPPERKSFRIDGEMRPAYRCKTRRVNSILITKINGALIPTLDPKREYSVFIQSHALRRLEERLGACIKSTGYIHECIPHSISMLEDEEDTSVEGESNVVFLNGTILLPYFYNDHKIGYLTARIIDDNIVITTFFFLTMDGTPEGDLLCEKLKLVKKDKIFLNLDKLETFIHGDIKTDPVLVGILMECGCESLLNISTEELVKPPEMKAIKIAALIRKYIGMSILEK